MSFVNPIDAEKLGSPDLLNGGGFPRIEVGTHVAIVTKATEKFEKGTGEVWRFVFANASGERTISKRLPIDRRFAQNKDEELKIGRNLSILSQMITKSDHPTKKFQSANDLLGIVVILVVQSFIEREKNEEVFYVSGFRTLEEVQNDPRLEDELARIGEDYMRLSETKSSADFDLAQFGSNQAEIGADFVWPEVRQPEPSDFGLGLSAGAEAASAASVL